MYSLTQNSNPFALVRASEYTDGEINDLWVELDDNIINRLIEPASDSSKYLLGGRGTGKTHLLRYHAYPVIRLRTPDFKSGISIVEGTGYLAVFLRASTLDSSRFEAKKENQANWQQLFGVYLETQLAILVVEALCDIKSTSPKGTLDELAFIGAFSGSVSDKTLAALSTLEEVLHWLSELRYSIDDAINISAFSGKLEVYVPFSIGQLAIPLKKAIGQLHSILFDIPLIYMIDEIENFTQLQQEVVNTLLRFSERKASFRITGRLYAVKTFAVIGGAEINREGQDYRVENLDRILRENPKYRIFARSFVRKRLGRDIGADASAVDLSALFEETSSGDFFNPALKRLGIDNARFQFAQQFEEMLRTASKKKDLVGSAKEAVQLLVSDFPLILQKLNILLFCKKYKRNVSAYHLANNIRNQALEFMQGAMHEAYATAYGHYKQDLFAQLCREAKKAGEVPYAGFDLFVTMSCGNPRNLLIILGQIFEVATFKGMQFMDGPPIPIQVQSVAVRETAHFMFNLDCNSGILSDNARGAVERLATLLRTARYSLKIPEVSPLAVSFDEQLLSAPAKDSLKAALSYSLIFSAEGRKDRNSQRVLKKIQINPILSPYWGLSTGMRGDISLSPDIAEAIFNENSSEKFFNLLKIIQLKWSNPFDSTVSEVIQERLF